jgi:predicted DNA repair protein MutK
VAMFLVGGGIISHEVPWVHHHVEELRQMLVEWLGDGSAAAAGGLLLEAGLGILVGTLVLAGVATASRLRSVVWPRSHD